MHQPHTHDRRSPPSSCASHLAGTLHLAATSACTSHLTCTSHLACIPRASRASRPWPACPWPACPLPACTLPASRLHAPCRQLASISRRGLSCLSRLTCLFSRRPPPSPPSPRGDLKSSSASAVSLDCASAGGVPAHAATLTRVDQLNSLMATTLGGTVGRLVSGIYDATNSMGRSFVDIKDPPTSSLAVRDGK